MSRKGIIFLILIAFIFFVIGALTIASRFEDGDILGFFVRISALYGFLMMAMAVIMTPFLAEIKKVFGKPFLTVHHIFAGAGTLLATLHPVAFAIQVMDATVFLPSFRSWIEFWALAGRPALLLLYIALCAALLRKRWRQWRYAHVLMYVVLLFVIVHANLIGSDFSSFWIRLIYNLAFMAVLITFMYSVLKKVRRAGIQGGAQ
ncbi:MAG: hypothetical protein QHG99_07405 [Methanomicrobiales archaeon]|nr:hypothetical protein [Methanomicrobiales archaeon]